jgi:hypothetical protein
MEQMIKHVEKLPRADQQKILQFLHSRHVKISTAADGARINLDRLTKDQLSDLENLVNSMVLIQNMLSISFE